MKPSSVIVVDGAYSAHPELRDSLKLKVFVEVPKDVQLRARLVKEKVMSICLISILIGMGKPNTKKNIAPTRNHWVTSMNKRPFA